MTVKDKELINTILENLTKYTVMSKTAILDCLDNETKKHPNRCYKALKLLESQHKIVLMCSVGRETIYRIS